VESLSSDTRSLGVSDGHEFIDDGSIGSNEAAIDFYTRQLGFHLVTHAAPGSVSALRNAGLRLRGPMYLPRIEDSREGERRRQAVLRIGSAAAGRSGEEGSETWQKLRDHWEYSHVARAILALVALIALVIAVAL
jgi:catechol 2,3-dioxygenase-like lactoylglutathione lyase family enzyme